MAKKKWGHGSRNTIAQLFGSGEVKKLLSSDIVVGPDEVMVLIEDGRITDTYTQTKVKKVLGGMGEKFKRMVGKGKDVEVMLADTSEKKVFIHFGKEYVLHPYSLDDDLISGNLTIMFSIDRNNISSLYSQVANSKDKAITTRDVRVLVQNEIATRVLKPTIREFSTEDIGKMSTIKKIENECLKEVGRLFELYAIEPIRFTISFDLTDVDTIKQATRERELAGKLESGTYEREAFKAEEVAEIDEWKKDKIADREKKRMRRDVDIRKEASDLGHEARTDKEDKRHWEEQQAYEHRIEMEKRKERDRREMEDEITDAELSRKGRIIDSEIEIKKKVEDSKLESELKKAHTSSKVREKGFDQDMVELTGLLQIKSQQDKLKMAKDEHGTQMKVAEYQGTTLKGKEIDADVEKTRAMSEAEKAKYNMDVQNKALDRAHREKMEEMDKFTGMLSASRQNTPQTVVQGATQTRTELDVRDRGPKKVECDQCGGLVEQGVTFCPHCGERMD